MNTLKKYFFLTSILIISDSLFASKPATAAKSAAAAQLKAAAKVSPPAQQQTAAMGTAAAGSSAGSAAAVNIDDTLEGEYEAETTVEDLGSSVIKKIVIKHRSTGKRLDETVKYSKDPTLHTFAYTQDVIHEGDKDLHTALSFYKEGSVRWIAVGVAKQIASNGLIMDLSLFSHSPCTAIFSLTPMNSIEAKKKAGEKSDKNSK